MDRDEIWNGGRLWSGITRWILLQPRGEPMAEAYDFIDICHFDIICDRQMIKYLLVANRV